jgi:hypothetical protein
VISVASRVASVNTYGPDGWEVTGVDWETGCTVHRAVFGRVTAGNSASRAVRDCRATRCGGALVGATRGGLTSRSCRFVAEHHHT